MKRILLISMAFAAQFAAVAQTARLQVVHNSPEALAGEVDIYVNGNLFLDDFAYRTATSFVDVPAETPLVVGVAPSNSTSVNDTIANFDYTLIANETYMLVAQGVLNPLGYSPFQQFGLSVYVAAREEAASAGNTDVLVLHGATDAPTVDINESEVANVTLANDLSYGDFAGYLELATDDYVIDVALQNGDVAFSYEAPLQTLGLEDSAILVIASGFLNPAANSNGEDFGLFAVLPSGGDFIPLPAAQARLQVIHNSADALAEVVDIYLNDELLINDFEFRNASPFISAPANVALEIAVAPGNSTSSAQAVATVPVTLDARDTYVAIANGILSPTGYDPVQPFSLDIYDMGREEATTAGNTDVLIFHGSTDAPAVDVVESGLGAGVIADDLNYGDFDGYLELANEDYVLDITAQNGTVVRSYNAPLASLGLADSALVVVASGFLNPADNSDGPAFGLYVALPSGGSLIALPTSTARLQVIHNSADAAASTVDVYAGETLLIDDFEFRTATPFIDVPANVEISLGIAPANSTSSGDAIAVIPVTLENGGTYIAVADGLVSTEGYDPVQPFALAVYDMAREVAADPANTDVLVHHGSTDAPAVDVNEVLVGAGTIVDDLAYGSFAGYLELPTADYTLDILDETNTTKVAQFQAPLSTLGLGGEAITVVASGFLTPDANSDGAPFGLWVALASGGDLIALPQSPLNVNEVAGDRLILYPNPAVDFVSFSSLSANTSVEIYTTDGRLVLRESIRNGNGGIDVSSLNQGTYFVKVLEGEKAPTTKTLQIVR